MMVTRLACSFVIFDQPEAIFHTRMDGGPLDTYSFKTACILRDFGNDNYSVPLDDTTKSLVDPGAS